MKRSLTITAVISVAIGLLTVSPAGASDNAPTAKILPRQTSAPQGGADLARGVIVRTSGVAALAGVRAAASQVLPDVTVVSTQSIAPSTNVLIFDNLVTVDEASAVADALSTRKSVIWAEADVRMQRTATPVIPNDPLFDLMKPLWNGGGSNDFSVKAPLVWGKEVGDPGVVVAIIDTGVTRHPELDAQLVAGYDFVSDVRIANDGNGWDPDPADPGDWITASEDASGFFEDCGVGNSSWHGTHVAGTVAAIQNNDFGMTGVAPGARLQTIRVLGKCGGFLSDIAAGITWASGGSVSGVPANPTPAKVLNLSLGGNGTCAADSAFGQAISGAISRGATVVVAAGNEDEPMTEKRPANCAGVIAVTAVDIYGQRATYSNYGVASGQATIAAPGGDFRVDGGVLSTINEGTQSPVYPADPAGPWSFVPYQGTSMATPHVAGAAALLYSAGETSTTRVRQLLLAAVQPFPDYDNYWDCTVLECGAGILDLSRLQVPEPVTVPGAPTGVSGVAGAGQVTVSWSAPGSDGGSPVTGYTATASPGGASCSTSGALSCVVAGLSNGTAYSFTVTATNVAGVSSPSVASAPVTLATVPGKVTQVRATVRGRQVTLTWSAPTNTGGAAITGYRYRVGSAAWKSTSTARITVPLPRRGKSISVSIQAVNQVGFGPAVVQRIRGA
jgi:serine protease